MVYASLFLGQFFVETNVGKMKQWTVVVLKLVIQQYILISKQRQITLIDTSLILPKVRAVTLSRWRLHRSTVAALGVSERLPQ